MIGVVIDDLTTASGDALVRPATSGLAPASAVSERIDAVAGVVAKPAGSIEDRLEPGAAVVTGAGNLGVELIIHAIIMNDEREITPTWLRRAFQSMLERAVQFEIGHLLVPPAGVGPDQLDLDAVAKATVEVTRTHLLSAPYPTRVSIVVESDEERQVFEQAVRTLGIVG